MEEGDNLVDGGERSGEERWVYGKGFAGIDAHDFEADDFFFEFGRELFLSGEEEVVGVGIWFWGEVGVWLRRIWS